MLYDIHEVCALLRTTSRTLRYYEEKSLITSEKDPFSSRRRYTEEQLDRIRRVLSLRALGLSLKTIAALQRHDIELKDAVYARKAEIEATIQAKLRELSHLCQALAQSENTPSDEPVTYSSPPRTTTEAVSLQICEALLRDDFDTAVSLCSQKLQAYLPADVLRIAWHDTIAPLGRFVAYDSFLVDEALPHVCYRVLRYETMCLRVKLVFHTEKPDGLWLDYYKPKEGAL